MFPGTLAFSRFDYPSHLPDSVQARMGEIATTTMRGLGFDNGIFNIEMMYDVEDDRISIIEINPRMASQFADLYEKVDGTNSFAVLLDIAQGETPRFTRRQGRYAFAASCVLRSFEDYLVAAVPSAADIEQPRADLSGYQGRAARDARAQAFRRIPGWQELSLRRRSTLAVAISPMCLSNSRHAARSSVSSFCRSSRRTTGRAAKPVRSRSNLAHKKKRRRARCPPPPDLETRAG